MQVTVLAEICSSTLVAVEVGRNPLDLEASESVKVLTTDTVGDALGEVGTDADSHWHLAILPCPLGLCIRQRKV
jgi:hypothetical protein